MSSDANSREVGSVVALRYVIADCVEMCWPCRVVADREDVLALFIAAGSPYKAAPKKTAAEKRAPVQPRLPPAEYVWRKDTLRLMFPRRRHSVYLFWERDGTARRFAGYFVNMEEPFRRTAVGFDTADHTLDIVVTPDVEWTWRDEDELTNHVKHGLYTEALAAAVRAEAESVVAELERRSHPCLAGWRDWRPEPQWSVPAFPHGWELEPTTAWELAEWAYAGV